jgi:aspartyl-tRNA(Asn)/glutamyl-tRNA(Gln) amidotransferase subunit B
MPPSSLLCILSATRTTTLRAPRPCILAKWLQSRQLSSGPISSQEAVPLRKHLKDEAKRKKAEAKAANKDGGRRQNKVDPKQEKFELAVGIEIHAELNTATKLFSPASASVQEGNDAANSRVAMFDAALPGTQPQFQAATLLPALRAAIALGCDIQHRSGWDRKHYFHWDQPQGYQITQYYQPFALNGSIEVTAEDGVPLSDLNGAKSLTIGIKQVQMEQDTAKTTAFGDSTYHIDFNRAGHPLIEIITLPHIHSPQTAAAVVRKIAATIKSVDACVAGMELGGLRADVNVSVRERGTNGAYSYSGVGGLGQRTEIKNLSSFKAVEDAIIAERDRQIAVLESGGVILGETRGWTLGAKETTRLRGKEGEVDYRYMPDADLPPLFIGENLVRHLSDTLPELPDATIARLQMVYGITLKDARTLVTLDDGDRLEYLEETISLIQAAGPDLEPAKVSRTAANWVLHELGGLLGPASTWTAEMSVSPEELASILTHLLTKQINARAGKQLVSILFSDASSPSARPTVRDLIEQNNFILRPLTDQEYEALARDILAENEGVIETIRQDRKKGKEGKLMYLVGQMVRKGDEGTVEPQKAKEVLMALVE